MKTAYSFVVLRYVHDIVSSEFINVGVALFSPETQYVGAKCNTRYGRLNKMFLNVDGEYFRGIMRYIETRFEEAGDRLRNGLLFHDTPANIIEIARGVLPPDDSSLQWSEAGGGYTADPEKTLEDLLVRLVEHYEDRAEQPRRTDEDVWKAFKAELEPRHLLARLRPKQIIAQDYSYEFKHAWKNQKWHMCEPLSFDLLEDDSILDKANRWLGRSITLQDSPDKFKLHLLLGEPSLGRLKPAFAKAENILNKIPIEKELIRESDARQFSEALAGEIAVHEAEG